MSLEKIGQLAVDLHHATAERKRAKDCLRDKYAEFCREEGICDCDQDLRYVRNDHPAYSVMQAYAAEEVKAYARAKLDEYNLKRKLNRAIQSLGNAVHGGDA